MLESPTLSLLTLALDATSMRHLAIANNIANAASPGYQPQRVDFEEQLGQVRSALAAGEPLSAASLQGVAPQLKAEAPSASRLGASPTSMLDMELVRLAQNTMHYQALLRGVNRYVSIVSTAVNEGRR